MKRNFFWALISVILLSAPFLFQNCSSDLKATGGIKDLASEEDHEAPHLIVKSSTFIANQDIVFSIHDHDNVINASSIVNWTHTFNSTMSCVVVAQPIAIDYGLKCSGAGVLIVTLSINSDGKFYGPLTQTINVTGTAPVGNVVVFDIANGTGDNPWNTMATQVEVYVGQTLRIRNLDTTVGAAPKRLHTNGKPFPHGPTDIPVNGQVEYIVQTGYNSATDGVLYNHNLTPAARFYMISHDGAALYTANCASCHGPLATSVKKGASAILITSAIATKPQMNKPAIKALTPKQIEAIAFALK
jgi:hypothetical protein